MISKKAIIVFVVSVLLFIVITIWHFLLGSLDTMACRMSYMWPDYIKYPFLSKYGYKYSLYLFKNRGKHDDGTKLVGLTMWIILSKSNL